MCRTSVRRVQLNAMLPWQITSDHWKLNFGDKTKQKHETTYKRLFRTIKKIIIQSQPWNKKVKKKKHMLFYIIAFIYTLLPLFTLFSFSKKKKKALLSNLYIHFIHEILCSVLTSAVNMGRDYSDTKRSKFLSSTLLNLVSQQYS